MKDIPYSELKEDRRAYDIMLLRDQYNNTFADIAKEYGISLVRARELYSRVKIKQIRLYIRHISIALGYDNTVEVRKVYDAAHECFQDFSYACAYLEKKYSSILVEYRAGEPGMPKEYIKNLPPLKKSLNPEIVSRIVEMREVEKATFTAIAKEMAITPEKAKHTYDMFYHQQVLDFIEPLQQEASSYEEKRAIWQHYFGKYRSAKKRYEMILEEKRETQNIG